MANPDPEQTQFPQMLKHNIHLHYVSHSNQEIKTKDHSLQNPILIHILSPQITFHQSNLLPVRVASLMPGPHTLLQGLTQPCQCSGLVQGRFNTSSTHLATTALSFAVTSLPETNCGLRSCWICSNLERFPYTCTGQFTYTWYNAIEALHLHVSDSPCSC